MPDLSLTEKKYFEGVEWFKVFWHKMEKEGDGFNSFEEASFSNTTNKFSILSTIDSKYKIQGKYEFLLFYPSLSGYNRWRQSNFPLYESDFDGKTCAAGYRGIHIDWTSNEWCGLVRSIKNSVYGCIPSLLDGTVGSQNWYYTIGFINKCSNNIGAIPGPTGTVNEVILYIRNPQFYTCKRNSYKRHIHETKSLL